MLERTVARVEHTSGRADQARPRFQGRLLAVDCKPKGAGSQWIRVVALNGSRESGSTDMKMDRQTTDEARA
eukprot:3509491-Amphidinium_carterae.1